LLIEKLKLTIKKLRHEQFGQSSERGALLDRNRHEAPTSRS
jgi:transposase